MSHESTHPPASLISQEPVPEGAQAFSRQVHDLLDGKPKDEATVAQAFDGMDGMFDLIAAGLYSLASMLVGEGEQGVRLVETAVATAEVSACSDPLLGRKNSRRALCSAALEMIARRDPGCLAAPEPESGGPASCCVTDEERKAVEESGKALDRMIAGLDRDRVREWMASLPTLPRTVFVLRAVAGFTSVETAALLQAHGGEHAAGWTPEAVSKVFRRGLCSLGSQLLHTAAAR
jgi:hypothetical protein